jgi:hypothetical protein
MSRTSTIGKPRLGAIGIAPESNCDTNSTEAEKSPLSTGPNTMPGLTETNSMAPSSAATHARATSSARVLDFT